MKYLTIAALIVISTTLTLDEAPAAETKENTICYSGRRLPTLWERRNFIWHLQDIYCGAKTKTPYTIERCTALEPCFQWIRDNCGDDFKLCDKPKTEQEKRWDKRLEEIGYDT